MSNLGHWELDRPTMQVKHSSGLCLQIEGRFSEPSAVIPVSVPRDISAPALATLIRQGADYCRKQKEQDIRPQKPERPKPTRPVLSLKKR